MTDPGQGTFLKGHSRLRVPMGWLKVSNANIWQFNVSLFSVLFPSPSSNVMIFRIFSYKLGLPCGSAGKESACNVRNLGLIPGLGKSPGKGKGYPLQYSGLESSKNCVVHGTSKSRTLLNDFHFHFPI